MTGRVDDVPMSDAAIGLAPMIAISVSLTGLEPGMRVTLVADGQYEFPVFGCGIQPSPCAPGSDTTDPSLQLCRPAYEVQGVSGTASEAAEAVADLSGSATVTVELIARESMASCPVDATLPWYELSGAWTRIHVTDVAHGLRLLPEDVIHGP
jgi:hypothetical protein